MSNTVFHIAPRYLRSINLQKDYSEEQMGLAGYQATPLVLQTIARIVESIQSTTRAFSLIGPYGVGKSAFGVFLAHYLNHSAKERLDLVQRHAMSGIPTNFPIMSPSLYPILVGGNNTSLRHAILRNTLQAFDKLRHLNVEQKALYQSIQDATEDLDVDPLTVTSLLEQTTLSIAQAEIANGVVLVIDELGQYLNHVVRQQDDRDLFVLQTIAEMAARSGGVPFVILTILHQSFDLYTGNAGVSQRTEWAKVQGRFTELPFQEPTTQMLQMVGHALFAGNPLDDEVRKRWAEQLAPVTDELGLRPSDINITDWHTLVARSYPLHPLVVVAIPLLFRQLAQNERSLFAFLTSFEPWGLQDFINQPPTEEGIYRLHHLYNYIETNLGASLFGRARGQRWAELAEARALLEDASSLVLDVITTIGTLGALGQNRGLHANLAQISFALRDRVDAVDVASVIETLELRRQIVFRKYRGSYILFEGSDLDLDALIQDTRHQVSGRTSLISLLQQYTNTLPLVARQFSYRTGSVRHFAVHFIESSNIRSINQEIKDSDGVIWYVVATDNDSLAEAYTYVMSNKIAANHITVLPTRVQVIRDLLLDVASLRWILEHQPELESDRVARRELAARLAESEQVVSSAITQTYGPTSAHWVWQGEKLELSTSRDIDHLLTRVCETLYPSSPRIWNELIVRRQLSAMASKARRNLVEAMLEHGTEETLGITGFPAERAIYESVLHRTGIHRYHADGTWYFAPPSTNDTSGLLPVWNAIQQFFDSSVEQPKALVDLYAALESPPYGVKTGLTPLLFVAAYLVNSGEVALYEHGNFAPTPDVALFERLLRQPNYFSIRLTRASGMRVAIYERLARTLAPSAIGKSFQPAIMDAIKPLLKIVRRLPEYARTTHTLSPQTQGIRATLLTGRSPDEMLFDAIPQACGLPPIPAEHVYDEQLVERYFLELRTSLEELQGAYDKLLQEIKDLIQAAFKGQSSESEHLRNELRNRYTIIAPTITDSKIRALGIRIENAEPGNAWLETVAALVGRKPADSWSDQDFAAFKTQIADLGYRFRTLEQVAVTSQSLPADAPIVRVGITDTKGEQSVVLHRSELSLDQEAFRKDLYQLLDQHSTLTAQQQTIVLTELLQQLLSSGEVA